MNNDDNVNDNVNNNNAHGDEAMDNGNDHSSASGNGSNGPVDPNVIEVRPGWDTGHMFTFMPTLNPYYAGYDFEKEEEEAGRLRFLEPRVTPRNHDEDVIMNLFDASTWLQLGNQQAPTTIDRFGHERTGVQSDRPPSSYEPQLSYMNLGAGDVYSRSILNGSRESSDHAYI